MLPQLLLDEILFVGVGGLRNVLIRIDEKIEVPQLPRPGHMFIHRVIKISKQ